MTTGAAAGGLPEKTVHRRDQSMNKTSHPILSMVVSRVGLGLLSLLIVSLVIFFSVSLLPGSYASAILGQNATPEAVAAMEEKLGLNEPALWRYILWLGAAAALISVSAGLFLAFGARRASGPAPKVIARATMIGYAAPGAVLAVGVLIPMAGLDRIIHYTSLDLFGVGTGLLLTGSAAAVIFAYVVRFNAIAYGAIDGAFGRVTPSMDMAARTLGETAGGALRRVHLPIISGSMVTAAMLVFVDAVKELPATLILRPFNFSTLATHVYDYASREHLAEAAPAALAIVVVGILPVAILIRGLGPLRPGENAD